MVRTKELSTEIRAEVDILRRNSFKYHEMAKKPRFGVAAAYYTVKRANELGSYASRRGIGRPKVSGERTDRAIARIVKYSPKASSLLVMLRLPLHSRNISTRCA
jgi:hypothetical protein